MEHPLVSPPPATQPASEASQPPAAGKLDLSRMAPPESVEELRLEELTIDGICGVY